MQSTDVTISEQLKGEWRHNAGRERLIILCHGFQSSSENTTIVYMAAALNELGYDTFTFNLSPNTGGFDIEQQVHDIEQITDHFSEYKQLILLGCSFAALTTAIATVRLASVSKLITVNGFFGRGALGGEYRRAYLKFRIAAVALPTYRRIYRYYKRQLQPEKITVPVLTLHTRLDQQVFISQSMWFYGKLGDPKKFVEIAATNHGITDDTDRDEVVTLIDTWLGEGT